MKKSFWIILLYLSLFCTLFMNLAIELYFYTSVGDVEGKRNFYLFTGIGIIAIIVCIVQIFRDESK